MSFIKSKLQTAINNNMKNTFKTLLFISLLCGVSGADEMKSVMEGDSVTLQTDDNKILTYNQIMWRFKGVAIAEITDEGKIKDVTDVRFRGRLKLDNQTGSLTITNTRTIHSGEYKIQIDTNSGRIEKTFTLTVYESSPEIGPDTSEVKPVEVIEGESVTLNTDINPHGDELIVWRFGSILIAKDDKENNKTPLYPDGRFKGRIHLDQTGSLIINNSRTAHTGEYKLKISSNRDTKHKRFSLYVKESPSVIDAGISDVKSVSVMGGKSVSLNTDINPHGDELIVWRFGDNGALIAKVDKENNKTSLYPDERFKDRIHLDQTGSLIISNSRTADTGEYKLKISSSRDTKHTRFILTVNHPPPPPMSTDAIAGIIVLAVVAGLLLIAGVIYYIKRLLDEWRTVFVMKGDPITLITNHFLIKIFNVNVYYGETLIADKIEIRERLELNHQTGSLIITDSRRSDAGIYQLKFIICTVEITFKRISVTVRDEVIRKTVKEGNFVDLFIGVIELQEDAEVELKFKNTVIADKKQKDKTISVRQDTHGGKFKQNLKVDQLSGSLSITEFRPDQSGDYELKIISSRETVHKIIRVSVSDKASVEDLYQNIMADDEENESDGLMNNAAADEVNKKQVTSPV